MLSHPRTPSSWAARPGGSGGTGTPGRTGGTGRAGAVPLGAPGPARVGDVLDRTLRSLGTPSVAGVEVVFERWGEVGGAAMAARTRPVRIDGDALVVGCDEPAVATHVRFLQAEIVERVGQLSGDRRIARVEVRVTQARRGPRPPRPATRSARRGPHTGASTGAARRPARAG
jgi:hypothetical protein